MCALYTQSSLHLSTLHRLGALSFGVKSAVYAAQAYELGCSCLPLVQQPSCSVRDSQSDLPPCTCRPAADSNSSRFPAEQYANGSLDQAQPLMVSVGGNPAHSQRLSEVSLADSPKCACWLVTLPARTVGVAQVTRLSEGFPVVDHQLQASLNYLSQAYMDSSISTCRP